MKVVKSGWARTLYLIFFLLASYSVAVAQQDKVDQLNAKASRFLNLPDSLFSYAKPAYDLALQSKYAAGEGIASKLLGVYYHRKTDYTTALSYYNNGLQIFQTLNNRLEIAKAYLNIATTHSARQDYVLSVDNGLKALKLFEALNDPNGIGRVLNLLAISASAGKDFKSAKNYFLRYSAFAKKAKDTTEIATSYNNLGSTYTKLGKPDSAVYYFNQAIALHARKQNWRGMGSVHQNMGAVYQDRGDYKKALDQHKQSLVYYEKLGDKKAISQGYYNIGGTYKKLKDTLSALPWLTKALTLANAIEEKEIIFKANESLAEIKATDNRYKAAYEQLKVAVTANDSILNVGKTRIVEELITKYETEKKEARIRELAQQGEIQELEIQRRKIYLIVLGILLVLSLLIAYLIINRRKLQERTRMQLAINTQQDITARTVLEAEERERRRIAGDLHDGVGQLLSAALMNLNGLFTKMDLSGEQQVRANSTLALVNESYDEMRSISHQMMPNALLKAGLASAIKEFLSKIDQEKIKVSLETVGLNERLSEQLETVLYRVIQETVNNVIKHASASNLSILLLKDIDGVTVSIEDNGVGFDKRKLLDADGIGMRNIFSRVELLKGSVDIDTGEGKGTLVTIHIPS